MGSDHWLVDSKTLSKLLPMADNSAFRQAFRAIKQENKRRLADLLESELGITVNVDSIFACQIKRLHEVNILYLTDISTRDRPLPSLA
jgi:glycogen phosphorylase